MGDSSNGREEAAVASATLEIDAQKTAFAGAIASKAISASLGDAVFVFSQSTTHEHHAFAAVPNGRSFRRICQGKSELLLARTQMAIPILPVAVVTLARVTVEGKRKARASAHQRLIQPNHESWSESA